MSSSSKSNFFSISSVALRAGDKVHGEQMEDAFKTISSLPEDVFIVTGDQGSLKASRSLLCMFSPTLREVFSAIPCCISPTIFLPDCSNTSIKHLLSLISTGVTSNDKIVPKEVMTAADVLDIKLKNIIRGTFNNNAKTTQDNAKRKSSEVAGDSQNGKKLCLKFNFQNAKEKTSDQTLNPVSPQLQPSSIAIQLQTVFPQLQQSSLGFQSPSITGSMASPQTPSIVGSIPSQQSSPTIPSMPAPAPSSKSSTILPAPSSKSSTILPAPASKSSTILPSKKELFPSTSSTRQNSVITSNKKSKASNKLVSSVKTVQTKKMVEEDIKDTSSPNLRTDAGSEQISQQQSCQQPNIADSVKSEPFACQLCDKNYFRNVNDLWQHYCASHFQEELRAQFGSYLKGKTCLSCTEKFITRPDAAKHIGIKHQQVNVILKNKGLEELPQPLTPKLPITSEGYYFVDMEKDKITLETKEPKINTLVDLETNKTLSNIEVVANSKDCKTSKFTDEQEEVLREAYLEDGNLSAERRNTLSIALGLKENEVEDWFKKKKLEQSVELEENVDLTSSTEEFLTLEFETDPQLTEHRKVGLAIALGLNENKVSKFFKSKKLEQSRTKKHTPDKKDDLNKFVGKNIDDILNASKVDKIAKIDEILNKSIDKMYRVDEMTEDILTAQQSTENRNGQNKIANSNADNEESINWLNNFLQQKIDKAKEDPPIKTLAKENEIENIISEHLKNDSINRDKSQKKFTKFSAETVKNLKKEFSEDKGMLSLQRRKFIATKLELTEDQVKNWYSKERRRLKT